MEEKLPLNPTPEEFAKLQASHGRRMRFYGFCWLLWIVGTILIVLNWNESVSPEVGWVGFGIAGAGTLLSFLVYVPRKPRRPFS